MGKMIIVTGYLAALKTTVSQRLSNTLHLVCFNKDTIKEILGESIGFRNREENLKLSRATFLLMRAFAEKMLETDQCFILESNFKAFELAELRSIAKLDQHHVLTLFLKGDPDVLYERFVHRQPNRHPVHTSAGHLSLEAFKQTTREFLPEDGIGEIIEIDTTHFSEDDYQNLRMKVSDFIDA